MDLMSFCMGEKGRRWDPLTNGKAMLGIISAQTKAMWSRCHKEENYMNLTEKSG